MTYKNPKELLTAATALPAAIEAKLPEGAPKISTKLLEFTDKMPDLPDFLVEIPDLPPVPEIPELPGTPELRKRYVTEVEVRPTPPAPPAPLAPTDTITKKQLVPPAVGGGKIIEGRGF